MPSVWPEPFGLVGIEAGCVGLPAAGFGVGGIPDWLRPGETGELASRKSTNGEQPGLADAHRSRTQRSGPSRTPGELGRGGWLRNSICLGIWTRCWMCWDRPALITRSRNRRSRPGWGRSFAISENQRSPKSACKRNRLPGVGDSIGDVPNDRRARPADETRLDRASMSSQSCLTRNWRKIVQSHCQPDQGRQN